MILSPGALVAVASAFAERIRTPAAECESASWDAALVHHWGFWSHYDDRTQTSAWPLAAMTTAELLGGFAERHRLLRTTPSVGDVFLQFSPARGEFVRTGVVARIYDDMPADSEYWDIVAIEGGSGDHGELAGAVTHRVVRRLSARRGDRFIRWTDGVR